MAERTVVLVKLHTVTFDEEESHMTNGEMIEDALHNIAQNVRSAAEELEFGYRENFDAIFVCDDEIDHPIKMVMAANELHTRSFGAEEYMVPECDVNRAEFEEEQVLTLNEYALHDWIVALPHTKNMVARTDIEDAGGGTFFYKLKLEIDGYRDKEGKLIKISKGDRAKLEAEANELLEAISNFDALVHDLAEYSC